MSYSQISLEKKKYDFKISAFAFSQIAILFFGATLGFWIVTGVRWQEVDVNPVKTFLILAILFSVLLIVSSAIALITYLLYVKYRNLLDGFIDDSIVNLKKDSKPNSNININLTTPRPVTNVGPIKRVVTTTTTTTKKPITPTPVRPVSTPVARPVSPVRPIGATPSRASVVNSPLKK